MGGLPPSHLPSFRERHSFAAAACASLVFIGLHVLRTAFCVLICPGVHVHLERFQT